MLPPRRSASFAAELERIIDGGICTGCGACAQIDSGVSVDLVDGFMRPVLRSRVVTNEGRKLRALRAACPALRVDLPRPEGSTAHPILGPIVAAYRGWATDSDARYRGSSGGVLTAIITWLVESGEPTEVVSAAAATTPSRTVPVHITSREEALAAAGSRYGPVAVAADSDALTTSATCGKPCEVSALRALATIRGQENPLLLSFFCAGTPSQAATDDLICAHGHDPDDLSDFWYRGRGWPGRFTSVTRDGDVRQTPYDQSWGMGLGPRVQWRCRICPDGLGASADIVAGDLWLTDERGYPVFDEGDGQSVVIARTIRGHSALLAARDAGFVELDDVDLEAILAAQPYQVRRRTHLLGRLLGSRAMGMPLPQYRGFGLLRHALRVPRSQWREFRGTIMRLRARGRTFSLRRRL